MKRHNRAALALAALALVIPVSGCASLISPQQTAEYRYNGGDGAWGTVGDVEVRGLLLIMDESGEGPAQLFFTLINKGTEAANVTVAVSGDSFSETVPAGGTFIQDPESPASTDTEQLIVDPIDAKPGDLIDVTVSTGGQEQNIETQVLSNVLPYYEEYLPSESPSEVPTESATEDASTEGTGTETSTPTEGAASTEGTTSNEGTTSTEGTATANG